MITRKPERRSVDLLLIIAYLVINTLSQVHLHIYRMQKDKMARHKVTSNLSRQAFKRMIFVEELWKLPSQVHQNETNGISRV